MFRRPRILKRRPDGSFDLNLDPQLRDVLAALLADLADHLQESPDHPDMVRLRPPAYLDDAERDAAYQLLAGDELRTARQAAIDTVSASLRRDHLTEAEAWAWLQALNALRLVVGTRLDISEDDQGVELADDTPDEVAQLWAIYQFTTELQHLVVEALGS